MGLSAAFTRAYKGGPSIEAELEVRLGAFGLTVLFGPSGCGKSTILRCLAGLETPDRGKIQAGGETWFQAGQEPVPAWRRGIGLVFQDSLLFPHLGVAGNIAFGLRHWPARERRQRVAELVGLMGLGELGERRARELSGGQRQRVALARALAPKPRLVLLDEPFASLDRPAADLLRHNLRQILQALEVPAILVTHDPAEALALGDRLLLMEGGRVVREGPPSVILASLEERPDEQLGAVVRARVAGRTEGLLRLAAGEAELFAPDPGGTFRAVERSAQDPGGTFRDVERCAQDPGGGVREVYACIRGEGVSLERGGHGLSTQRNRLQATILAIEPLGALTRVRLQAGFPLQALITTWAAEDLELRVGQQVHALIKASAIRVIPVEA